MEIRQVYLAAAEVVARCLEHPAVARAWDTPSALERMSVGELAAHLARSVQQVRAFLENDDPAEATPITAEVYFAVLTGSADLDSPLNVGVRQRSADGAAAGPDGVARLVRQDLGELARELPETPASRQVTAFGGNAMTVDEYLRTRLVEFAAHHDDLHHSLEGADLPDLPDDVRTAAVEVLVGVARHRHGDRAVLRALARRERDTGDVLRVV